MYQGSFLELTDSTPAAVAMVDGNGDQVTGFDGSRPANAAVTAVSFNAATQVMLAANAQRRQFKVYNGTNKPVNIAYAATASATVFTDVVAAGASLESVLNGYTGVISCFWPATATGNLHVTEVTT